MNYLTTDLVFASNSKTAIHFLNDVSRYSFGIQPVRRIRGKNRYTLAALGRAYLVGALQQQCVPTSSIPELFSRIHWEAFDLAVDQLEVGDIANVVKCHHSHEATRHDSPL